jgi:hypothetical protein
MRIDGLVKSQKMYFLSFRPAVLALVAAGFHDSTELVEVRSDDFLRMYQIWGLKNS